MRARHGEKDVDWTYGEGTSALGTEAVVNVINGNAFSEGNSTWGKNPAGIMTHKNYIPLLIEGEGNLALAAKLFNRECALCILIRTLKFSDKSCIGIAADKNIYTVKRKL